MKVLLEIFMSVCSLEVRVVWYLLVAYFDGGVFADGVSANDGIQDRVYVLVYILYQNHVTITNALLQHVQISNNFYYLYTAT